MYIIYLYNTLPKEVMFLFDTINTNLYNHKMLDKIKKELRFKKIFLSNSKKKNYMMIHDDLKMYIYFIYKEVIMDNVITTYSQKIKHIFYVNY